MLREVVRPLHRVGREIPVPRAHRRGVEREAEPLLAAPRLFLGARPLHRERDLRGDHAGQLQLLGAGRVRRGEVQHELADDAVEAHERDERQRRDAFGLEDRQKRRERRVAAHVATTIGCGSGVSGVQGVWPSTAGRYSSERPR